MKAYYEYEDGTFWAMRTECNDCFTAYGSKYNSFNPEIMLEAKTTVETERNRRLSNMLRTIYADPVTA